MADSGECRADAGARGAGYERLRATVLAGGAGGWRPGHGVLSARGMTAWMSAFGEPDSPDLATAGAEIGAVASSSEGCEQRVGVPAVLPAADQVVAVLTQMVLPLAA